MSGAGAGPSSIFTWSTRPRILCSLCAHAAPHLLELWFASSMKAVSKTRILVLSVIASRSSDSTAHAVASGSAHCPALGRVYHQDSQQD
mmetsp:Transcript_27816/g.74934  ORF Transcript_27816/g.74934 Transcript_27816/m.74934 type:complete len:89 (+) Transcript_27816:179-445(+)